MKYFSMFSGIGGFEVGIQAACPSAKCVGYSEINKHAIKVYQQHFTGHKNYGDATTINPDELSDFNLLVGGFPCQAFSVAGAKRGFEDTRGTLFFEIARIAKHKQPRILLLENVKGLLYHDGGNTFRAILSTLDGMGYDAEWQILNSKSFGVPQNRERVFIIGHLRGATRCKIFPFEGRSQQNDQCFIKPKEQKVQRIPLKFLNRNQKNIEGDYSYTIDCGNTGGVMVNDLIRRFTPLECERLQGFPDNWTSCLNDTQRYKCLGNAVTTNVVAAVMEKISDNSDYRNYTK